MSPSHYLIHFNIILPSTPTYSKWSLSLRFPHQNPVYKLPIPQTSYIPRPSHSSRYLHFGNSLYDSSTVQITLLGPYLLHFPQCHGHGTLTYKPYFIFDVQLLKKNRNIGGYRTTLMSANAACILLRGRILCYRAVADRSHWQFQAARSPEVRS
jgi:hypothetical protein